MNNKFQNKFRIPSARLQSWDYSWNSAYFITICTKNAQNFFGKISGGKMELSEIGKITHTYWNEIPKHFPFIALGEFIAMPNHIHGIIIINRPPAHSDLQTPKLGVSTSNPADNWKTNIATNRTTSSGEKFLIQNDPSNSKSGGKKEQWKPGTLGVIVNQYKRICTIHARNINPDFTWHPRFYDNIIGEERAFETISEYIKNNPTKWNEDRFHKGSTK